MYCVKIRKGKNMQVTLDNWKYTHFIHSWAKQVEVQTEK